MDFDDRPIVLRRVMGCDGEDGGNDRSALEIHRKSVRTKTKIASSKHVPLYIVEALLYPRLYIDPC